MSGFVRNLVLRAAGLAPVLRPPVDPPAVEDAEPVVEEIETEEVAAPPVGKQREAPFESVTPRERLPEKARAPRREIREQAPAAPIASPARPPLPAAPVSDAAERSAPNVPAVERPPADEAASAPARRADQRGVGRRPGRNSPFRRQEKTSSPVLVAPAPAPDARQGPEERIAEPDVRTVREIEFVDAPALPPEVLERAAAVVERRVREEPGRVEVHIGRIEIVTPRAAVPAPAPAGKAPPRQPRGFAEHGLERRYLRRRWY